jgi:hypothetical protein
MEGFFLKRNTCSPQEDWVKESILPLHQKRSEGWRAFGSTHKIRTLSAIKPLLIKRYLLRVN